METLKVQLDEKKSKRVRKKAMEIYGHSKGSISKAVNAALDKWLASIEGKKGKIRAESLTGMVSDLKYSSLSAQKMKYSSLSAQKKAVKIMGSVD